MNYLETEPEEGHPSASTAEPRNTFLEEKAFKSRTVLVFGTINDQSAADIAIHAQEIIKARERIARTIARETGRPLDTVLQEIERDRWMGPEEAIEYGLVGRIIQKKSDLKG